MNWGYRLVRRMVEIGGVRHEIFSIISIGIDDEGCFSKWDPFPVAPTGATSAEVVDDLRLMIKAIAATEVIDYDKLPPLAKAYGQSTSRKLERVFMMGEDAFLTEADDEEPLKE